MHAVSPITSASDYDAQDTGQRINLRFETRPGNGSFALGQNSRQTQHQAEEGKIVINRNHLGAA